MLLFDDHGAPQCRMARGEQWRVADASGIGEAGTEEAAGTKEADADPPSLCFLAIWAFSLRSFVQSRFSFVS